MDLTGMPDQVLESDLRQRAEQRAVLGTVPDYILRDAVLQRQQGDPDLLAERGLRSLADQLRADLSPTAKELLEASARDAQATAIYTALSQMEPLRNHARSPIHSLRDEAMQRRTAARNARSTPPPSDEASFESEVFKLAVVLLAADLAAGDYVDPRLNHDDGANLW